MKTRGKPDYLLFCLTLLLVGFGIVMVYSSSSIYAYAFQKGDAAYYVKKQCLWVLIGGISLLFTMNIPYAFFKKHYIKIVGAVFIVLVATLVPGIGSVHKGARSWIDFGPVSLEPAEFAKLAIVIYLSGIISKKQDRFRDFGKGLLPAMIVVVVFFLAIALQPAFGMAGIFLITAVTVILGGGANMKHLAFMGLPVLGFSALYTLFSPYRLQRILNFRDPWNDGMNGLGNGYQLVHSYFALAHGGVLGAGLGKSIEKYLYLPESQTDFIFAIIGEELGFIGAAIFLLVYLLFLWRIILISLRTEDVFARLLGVGIMAMTFIQAFINIGGAEGIVPITGVPLPFVSYGGSSILLYMTSVGIVLSISRELSKRNLEMLIKQKRQEGDGNKQPSHNLNTAK
ncbi:putative lipid II flippase FtsW [Aneurinibacillus sp. Ricciae_BoGa-3]|uniref:putative lipid II flippase FtsW n=1 Tax=Aneurinibacillus sp. Ricciae_BoGa-3 TaxID=3022697 RepID=UPI00234088E6|nr:putative lipid II flippase FtsW [Aneurinibacillus sp. Ricciae_BoGa-3]WCK53603.1 putative lipid II flippase FtsW [Aneurinibacillus sp. Ricciae_BoGa-3]